MINVQEAYQISNQSNVERQIRQAAAQGYKNITVVMFYQEEAELAIEVCATNGFLVGNLSFEFNKYCFNISWDIGTPKYNIY